MDCRQLVLSEGETLPLLSFSFDISVFLVLGMVRSSEGRRQGMKPKRLLSQLNLQLMVLLSSSVLISPSYLSYSAPQYVTSAAACMPRMPPASGPGHHFLMLPRQGMGCSSLSPRSPQRLRASNLPGRSTLHVWPYLSPVEPKAKPRGVGMGSTPSP